MKKRVTPVDSSSPHRNLSELEERLDGPMIFLGIVWLGLLILELTVGLNRWQEILSVLIWGIFILDFGLEFFLASSKIKYLKNNWLVALSLFIPALRIFRIFRVIRILRFTRGTQGLRRCGRDVHL